MNNTTPCEAVVLAGGLGTRLRGALEPDIPKPMAPINGIPFLSYVLDYLAHNGISKVVLSVHHLHEKISGYFGKTYRGMSLIYTIEDSLLGTGGGIRLASKKITSELFFALNGDSFFDVNLSLMYQFHIKKRQTRLTLAGKHMENCSRYGSINLTDDNRVISFDEKRNRLLGAINGGVYLINQIIWDSTEQKKVFSFEHDLMPELCSKGCCSAYVCDGFFIDIGIPDELNRAQSSRELALIHSRV